VYHAINSTRRNPDRGWGSSMAGEQLYTDAEYYKRDSQCGCGDRCGFVAIEPFWPFQLVLQNPYRELTAAVPG
jgi:hypothetical protein